MINIFDRGSTEQKKKITFIAIYATVAVIVCLLAALLISQAVANKNTPDPSGDDAGASADTFTEENVTDAQLHSGNLILVNKDNEYIFADNPEVVSFPTSGRVYGLKNSSLQSNPTALAAFNEVSADHIKNHLHSQIFSFSDLSFSGSVKSGRSNLTEPKGNMLFQHLRLQIFWHQKLRNIRKSPF